MKVCRRDSGLAQCELRMTVCADGSNRWKKERAVVKADPSARPTPVPATPPPAGPGPVRSVRPDLRCPSSAPLKPYDAKLYKRSSIPLITGDPDLHGYSIDNDGDPEFKCSYRINTKFGGMKEEGLTARWRAKGTGRGCFGRSMGTIVGWSGSIHSMTRDVKIHYEFDRIDQEWAESLAREFLRKIEPYAVPCQPRGY